MLVVDDDDPQAATAPSRRAATAPRMAPIPTGLKLWRRSIVG
jgi:hypothetical protein